MTSLRTIWGIERSKVKDQGSQEIDDKINRFIQEGLVIEKGNSVILTREGKLLADKIASDLFI